MEYKVKSNENANIENIEKAIELLKMARFTLGGGGHEWVISRPEKFLDLILPHELVWVVQAISLLSDDLHTFERIS